MTTYYTAGWNQPGCLPDSAEPPPEFESTEEARAYLTGQIEEAAEQIAWDFDNEDGTPARERMLAFAGEVAGWWPQSGFGPDGLVYWIEEHDDYPDEETPHVGHFSRLGGTWWCDTCNSPYCERA